MKILTDLATSSQLENARVPGVILLHFDVHLCESKRCNYLEAVFYVVSDKELISRLGWLTAQFTAFLPYTEFKHTVVLDVTSCSLVARNIFNYMINKMLVYNLASLTAYTPPPPVHNYIKI